MTVSYVLIYLTYNYLSSSFKYLPKSSLVTLTWRLLASKRSLLELQQTLLKPAVAPLSDLCRFLGSLIFNRRFHPSILSIKHCLVMLLHMYMLIIQLLEIFGKNPDQIPNQSNTRRISQTPHNK